MIENRIIACDEVRNLRDYGGWQAQDGQQVRRGKLLRSGHWSDARQAAHSLLAELGVDVFVDLRRPSERAWQPNQLPKTPVVEELFSEGGDEKDPPHLRFLRAGNLTRDSVSAYMQSAYRRIPNEAHHQHLFRQTILKLGQGKTVLIHCAAGKDRTGILAAIILGLMGVEQDAIMEDYLLTNRAVDIKGLLPDITAKISDRLGEDIEPEVLMPMLGVSPDFLHEAQTIIGDPVQFAVDHLKITADDLANLRQQLLVPLT